MEEGQFGFILEVAGNHGVFWKWRERAEYISTILLVVKTYLYDESAEYSLRGVHCAKLCTLFELSVRLTCQNQKKKDV